MQGSAVQTKEQGTQLHSLSVLQAMRSLQNVGQHAMVLGGVLPRPAKPVCVMSFSSLRTTEQFCCELLASTSAYSLLALGYWLLAARYSRITAGSGS